VHAVGLVIIGEGEVVAGIEPAMVGMADGSEGAQFDHGYSPCRQSVSAAVEANLGIALRKEMAMIE
jgi:hypothetical protein